MDEVGSGDYSGAGERRFDVVWGGVGQDLADDAGGWGNIRRVAVRGESWPDRARRVMVMVGWGSGGGGG